MLKTDLEFRIAGLVKEEERLKDHCVFLKGKLEAEVESHDALKNTYDTLKSGVERGERATKDALSSALVLINYLTLFHE